MTTENEDTPDIIDMMDIEELRDSLRYTNKKLKELKKENSEYAKILSPDDACTLKLAISRYISNAEESKEHLAECLIDLCKFAKLLDKITKFQERYFAHRTLEAQAIKRLEDDYNKIRSEVLVLKENINH